MEKSNGWRHSVFGKLQKIWVVNRLRRCNFSALIVCSGGLDKLCSGLFFHHVKFYRFKHKISTRVVCANGKLPLFFVKTMHNIPKILT